MNYKEIAKKGRHGDTELRIVNGRPSHVNVPEARDIDLLGKYGEMKTQLLGSGTTNPSTGLPEYNWWQDQKKKADKWWNKKVKPIGKMNFAEANIYAVTGGLIDVSSQGAGAVNYDVFGSDKKDWDKANRLDQLGDAGTDFDQKAYVDAVRLGQGDLYLQGIGITSEADREYFEGTVDKDRIDMAGESKQAGMDSLAASTGENLMNIYGQQDQAMAQSGFESSGSISSAGKRAQTSAFSEHMRQKKDLDRGYRENMMGIGDAAGDEFYQTLDTLEESITG